MCKYAERCGDRGPVTIPGHVLRFLKSSKCACVKISVSVWVFLVTSSAFFEFLRQDPPPFEAILVIFGHRALILFCLKALGKNEKWRHFCAHAQWWSRWRRKNVENGHLAPSNLTFFINCDRQKRFLQNERRRAGLQNFASDFLIFACGLSYDLSKFSDDFTLFFRLWKTITKALGKN